MSVKSERYLIMPRTLNSFYFNPNFNALGTLNNFCVYTYVILTALMLVSMFVFDVNVFVNSCNVLYICK
jgi:hypothetical protein